MFNFTTPVSAIVEERPHRELLLKNTIDLPEYPANIGHWLHQSAAAFPDKAALKERQATGEWREISYATLQKRVNRLSNGLMTLGLPPMAPIAILSANCIEMAIAQLSAMQIGHPVAPISFAYSVRSQTGSLIKHILEVTDAPMLIMSDANLHMPKLKQWETGQRKLVAFANADGHELVTSFETLLTDEDSLSATAQERYDAVTHDAIAKIQFTSGSTNLPKGVEVTHGMLTSNQVSIYQLWPFLSGDDVMVDWLPWNHTFGGNFVSYMALMHGMTLHIDNGNPTPAGLDRTVDNIISVRPTVYFGVPASYAALYNRMKTDRDLRAAFFTRLKFIFVAAAALDQPTAAGLRELGKRETGREIPFFSAWGTTETAPCATLVYWPTSDIRVIGLPNPGTTVKLIPDDESRYEIRVTGPNITQGYYRNEAATTAAFDEEGYYRTGDAVAFSNPINPNAGLVFDGRIGEDFKLTSGVWVRNAQLRGSINGLGKPYLLEVIPAAPNKPDLTAIVIPNIPALRAKFVTISSLVEDDGAFLQATDVVTLFQNIFQQHNSLESGSSRRFNRFAILPQPLQFDRGELTDKGYINQRAVLRNHDTIVSALYADDDTPLVYRV